MEPPLIEIAFKSQKILDFQSDMDDLRNKIARIKKKDEVHTRFTISYIVVIKYDQWARQLL